MPETKTMFSLARPSSGMKPWTAARIGVVAAAGAPAHFLVGLEVLHRLPGLGLGHQRERLDRAAVPCVDVSAIDGLLERRRRAARP